MMENHVKSSIFGIKRRILHQNSSTLNFQTILIGLKMMRCTYIDKAKNWGFGIILIIENTVCMYLCIYLFRKFASSATLPFAPNVCQLRNSSTSES